MGNTRTVIVCQGTTAFMETSFQATAWVVTTRGDLNVIDETTIIATFNFNYWTSVRFEQAEDAQA